MAVPGGSPSAEVSTTEHGTSVQDSRSRPATPTRADSLTGRYSWKVVYTPAAADTAHTGKQSACDAEHFNITYTNDPGPGTDFP